MEDCQNMKFSQQQNWENKGLLAKEIEEGSIMGVLKYLGEGKNPNARCNDLFPNKTLIFLAIEMYCDSPSDQRLQVIQALIDKGANLGHFYDGDTPLLYANRKWGSAELLCFLIKNGANPNICSSSERGSYPFLASCSHFLVDDVRELISLGADPMIEMKWEKESGEVYEGPMLECFQKGFLRFEFNHEELLEMLEVCVGNRVKG